MISLLPPSIERAVIERLWDAPRARATIQRMPADVQIVPCEFRDPKAEHVPQEVLSEDRTTRTWKCRACSTVLLPSQHNPGAFVVEPDARHVLRDYRLRAP